jgi:hypothetical protein
VGQLYASASSQCLQDGGGQKSAKSHNIFSAAFLETKICVVLTYLISLDKAFQQE